MSQKFGRAIASRDHSVRIRRTDDMTRFVPFFGLFSALGTLVLMYYMPADMIFWRRKYKFIVSLFGSQFFHFGAAYFAYRVVNFVMFFFYRQIVHPFIVSAFFLALVFGNSNCFGRFSCVFFFIVSEHGKLNTELLFHNNRCLLCFSSEYLLSEPL